MAAINVTINGVIIDKYGRTISGPISVVGEMMYSDRGVGGGPLPGGPGDGGGGGGGEGIWGPGDPRPQPPIANVPGLPPNPDPPGFGLHPAHPIVLPDPPPIDPPIEPPTEPSSPNWQWGWNRSLGWHPVYVPGEGDPGPH